MAASIHATSTPSSVPGNTSGSTAEIDASCRIPLLVLFFSAAAWLLAGSLFGLIASLKFHSPEFAANCAWLTYGRVHAVATNALLYGFAIPAGLGVALWIFARLGGNPVRPGLAIALGGKLWNLGVLLGTIGILLGDSTGFENLELPRYAAVILLVAYLVIGVGIILTLHSRSERPLRPAQWFLLAALLWFPWIYSTAQLTLTVAPVRGVTQAIVSWWFSANLNYVWLALVGLAVLFYFLPKLMNRPLHSEHLALFTFWTLLFFASWSGIPNSAPLPAWIPALSTAATMLTVITVLTVMIQIHKTVGRGCSQTENPVPGKFFAFGAMAFVVAWLMNIAGALPPVGSITTFTWFTAAQSYLNLYGFFIMTIVGAIYYIVPRVTGMEWPCARSVRAHYWLAAAGTVLIVVPLAIGGVLQGIKLNHPPQDFSALTKSTLHFLRISTLGELLILAGHLLLLNNLTFLSVRYCRKHFVPIFVEATAEMKPAEVKP